MSDPKRALPPLSHRLRNKQRPVPSTIPPSVAATRPGGQQAGGACPTPGRAWQFQRRRRVEKDGPAGKDAPERRMCWIRDVLTCLASTRCKNKEHVLAVISPAESLIQTCISLSSRSANHALLCLTQAFRSRSRSTSFEPSTSSAPKPLGISRQRHGQGPRRLGKRRSLRTVANGEALGSVGGSTRLGVEKRRFGGHPMRSKGGRHVWFLSERTF